MGRSTTRERPGRPGQIAGLWLCALALASCTSTRSVDEVLAIPQPAVNRPTVNPRTVNPQTVDRPSDIPSEATEGSASETARPAAVAPAAGGGLATAAGSAGAPAAGPAADSATAGPRPSGEASESAKAPMAAGPSGPGAAAPFSLARLANLRLQASTRECSALLPRARAEDASYEDLMAASRALVLNADLRLQSTLALKSPPAPLPAPEVLIDLEDEVSSELKSEIRSLASGSANFARRALELRPGDPAAELFSTLGAGLRLWSMPTLQALASGAATTLPGQIKRLAATSPDFEGASPLRLKGRFQSRAPWPFKDLEAGRDALTAAVNVAPIPLNLLFLGDAHWLCGEQEAALERWLEATTARADAETESAAPFIQEIARLRIESAARKAGR